MKRTILKKFRYSDIAGWFQHSVKPVDDGRRYEWTLRHNNDPAWLVAVGSCEHLQDAYEAIREEALLHAAEKWAAAGNRLIRDYEFDDNSDVLTIEYVRLQ